MLPVNNKKAADAKSLDLAALRSSQNTSSQQQQVNLTQLLFDRARMEDEMRRRLMGGGGGGGSRKIEPYVPFGFLRMAQQMDAARILILNFLRTAPLNAPSLEKLATMISNLAMLAPVKAFMGNLGARINNSFISLAKTTVSLFDSAKALAASVLNAGIAATSNFINKLFKLFKKDGDLELKDEEEFEKNDLFEKLKTFLTKRGGEQDDNRRNIFSHIENLADQIVKKLFT